MIGWVTFATGATFAGSGAFCGAVPNLGAEMLVPVSLTSGVWVGSLDSFVRDSVARSLVDVPLGL